MPDASVRVITRHGGRVAPLASGGLEREAGRGGIAEVVVHADHLTHTPGQQRRGHDRAVPALAMHPHLAPGLPS